MKRKNEWVRQYAKEKGVKLWEIADKLGISEGTFIRKLRKELPCSEADTIYGLIDEIAEEHGIESEGG